MQVYCSALFPAIMFHKLVKALYHHPTVYFQSDVTVNAKQTVQPSIQPICELQMLWAQQGKVQCFTLLKIKIQQMTTNFHIAEHRTSSFLHVINSINSNRQQFLTITEHSMSTFSHAFNFELFF